MILNRPVVGFESQSRLTRLVIMPLGDVRLPYAADLELWQRTYSLSLLERALVRLSLSGTGTFFEIKEAWRGACLREEDLVLPLETRRLAYAAAVLERIMAVWTHPPYDDPSLIIYCADLTRYVDDAMVIEVQYRHRPASPS